MGGRLGVGRRVSGGFVRRRRVGGLERGVGSSASDRGVAGQIKTGRFWTGQVSSRRSSRIGAGQVSSRRSSRIGGDQVRSGRSSRTGGDRRLIGIWRRILRRLGRSRCLRHRDPGGRRLIDGRGVVGRRFDGRGQRRRRAADLAQVAEVVLVDLHAQGQALPKRDHLRRGRLPTPGREQETLGQGPQVDRVGLAPGHGVSGQHQRAALGYQVVRAEAGYARVGGVEGSDLLPASGRVEELGGDAAERVGRPGDVVGPYRHDLGRLLQGGHPGLLDRRRHGLLDARRGRVCVRRHHRVPGVGRANTRRRHRGMFGARRRAGQGVAAVGFGRPAGLGGRLGLARRLDRLDVGDGLGEQGRALSVPGLGGLGFVFARRALLPAPAPGVFGRARFARAGFTPLQAVHDGGDEQRQGADPGHGQDQDDEVEGEASRQRTVVHQVLDVGPSGRRLEPGRAQHNQDGDGEADHHKGGEHVEEKVLVRALAAAFRGVGRELAVGPVEISLVGAGRGARGKMHHERAILTVGLQVATRRVRDPPSRGSRLIRALFDRHSMAIIR